MCVCVCVWSVSIQSICVGAKPLDVITLVGVLELCVCVLASVSAQCVLAESAEQCITGPGNARV